MESFETQSLLSALVLVAPAWVMLDKRSERKEVIWHYTCNHSGVWRVEKGLVGSARRVLSVVAVTL